MARYYSKEKEIEMEEKMANLSLQDLRKAAKTAIFKKNAIEASKLVLAKVAQIHESTFHIVTDDSTKSAITDFSKVFHIHNDISKIETESVRSKFLKKVSNDQYNVKYEEFMPVVISLVKNEAIINKYLVSELQYLKTNHLEDQLQQYCDNTTDNLYYNRSVNSGEDHPVYCSSDFINYTYDILGLS